MSLRKALLRGLLPLSIVGTYLGASTFLSLNADPPSILQADEDDDDERRGRKRGKKRGKDDDDERRGRKKEKKGDDDVNDLLEGTGLAALDTVPVPLPPNLDDFVKDRKHAILLGKALFWDMQVGSDGRTACASCHFHAGVDNRTRNTLAPSPSGLGTFRGANQLLEAGDFPFHRLQDPEEARDDDNPVIFDTSEIVGSQGVIKRDFDGINDGSAVDFGTTVPDPVFNVGGVNVRQVTGRNSPTAINAVFNDRQFWDGRANRFFNGVNPFGDTDPDARIWVANGKNGPLGRERILLDNGSLASQAVGPPLSDVEMSWNGRTFPELGRKMLQLRPLPKPEVAKDDSVLGKYAEKKGKGLKKNVDYAELVKKAFHKKYWESNSITPDGFTLMEANFSLFWGLSIMMYESTLVSDDSPFDRFAKGDVYALTELEKEGLEIFVNQGQCIACHSGPEFTGAAISQLRGVLADPEEPLIELMDMEIGPEAFYDGGFYNIGVRPTEEDLGLGSEGPFGPFSLSRRVQQGQDPDLNGQEVTIGPNDRVAVDGAFKTPSLRNIELTGPYMHNGGMRTLEEVVLFYARGADFLEENIDDLDPDVDGIGHVRGNQRRVKALVAFLKSLTDERVRWQRAPFDHPELIIPNGHGRVRGGVATDKIIVLPAVGRRGSLPVVPFEKKVR